MKDSSCSLVRENGVTIEVLEDVLVVDESGNGSAIQSGSEKDAVVGVVNWTIDDDFARSGGGRVIGERSAVCEGFSGGVVIVDHVIMTSNDERLVRPSKL